MINKKNIMDLLLYIVVGACATVTEWLIFFLLNKGTVHYVPATVIAYLLSTMVNWWVGRQLIFKENRKPIFKELGAIYLTSLIGLALNLLIMWVAVDLLSAHEMLSKIIATVLVFLYNFLMRKLCIYK